MEVQLASTCCYVEISSKSLMHLDMRQLFETFPLVKLNWLTLEYFILK